MSTALAILEALSKLCPGGHVHTHLLDGKAKNAAVYPPQLCKTILRGIDAQRTHDGGSILPPALQQNMDLGTAIFNLDTNDGEVVLETAGPDDIQHETDALGDWDGDWGWGPDENGQLLGMTSLVSFSRLRWCIMHVARQLSSC